MKTFSATFVLLVSCLSLAAQVNLDSLWNIWQNESQPDTIRAKAMHDYILDGYMYSQTDSVFHLAQLEYEFAESKGLKNYMADALNLQGMSFHLRSNYPKALDYYQRSLHIAEEIRNKRRVANVLNNIGLIYKNQGNNQRALEYGQRSLKIHEEIADTNKICLSLNNIGLIYENQGNTSKALDYYQRSLKISEEIGNKRIVSMALNNIGNICYEQNNYTKALDYYLRSLDIDEQIGDKKKIANACNNIGGVFIQQNDPKNALTWCEKGLNISKEIGAIDWQKSACECLYKAYKALGDNRKALEYHEQMFTLEDSLKSTETARKLEQLEFQKQMVADSIAQAEKELKMQMESDRKLRAQSKARNIAIGVGILLLLLAGGFYSRWRYVRKSKAAIEKEKDRSENLLLNILPAEIAEELKETGRAEARDFDMVSILFTDFKEFTQTSEKLSAQELVEEINVCFEAFDTICGKYSIEKIKTIGDAYMAAGGLPMPDEASAKNTVLAGLEMAQFIEDRKAEREQEGKIGFQMRAGVHTGPVVAGIVGVKKFQYDIWGDTVNTASRMESNGEVRKVNISQDTYALIKEDPEFNFEPRGKLEVKGKGEVEMFFVSLKQSA